MNGGSGRKWRGKGELSGKIEGEKGMGSERKGKRLIKESK
jgi:hypothetical protein